MDRKIDIAEIRKERNKRLLKGGLIAAAVIGAIIALMSLISGRSVKRSELRLGEAEYGPLETSVSASGRVVPAFEEIIISPVSSRILEVYARPGDTVKAGAPLLRLDLREAEAQVQNLRDNYQIKNKSLDQQRLANRSTLADLEMQCQIKEMEVNRLVIEMNNERRLDSLGSGTGDRVREAETALATGRLQLEGLRKKLVNERQRLAALETSLSLEVGNSARDLSLMEQTLSQGRIPAPRDGVLTFIVNSIGSTVANGEKVAVLGDLSSFKVLADVPEGSSYKVQAGAAATVRLGNIKLEGSVVNIEPQSTSGAVPFTVSLSDASNKRLRPGVRVQVDVAYGFKERVLRIPAGTYYKGPGKYNLFVQEDENTLRRREVTLGDSNSNFVEVTAGLNPGDKVVTMDMEHFDKNSKLTIK